MKAGWRTSCSAYYASSGEPVVSSSCTAASELFAGTTLSTSEALCGGQLKLARHPQSDAEEDDDDDDVVFDKTVALSWESSYSYTRTLSSVPDARGERPGVTSTADALLLVCSVQTSSVSYATST